MHKHTGCTLENPTRIGLTSCWACLRCTPTMASYATRSAYEFTESPKKSPLKPTPTPINPETPPRSAFSAFLSSKWGNFTARASEVAQKARGRLHEIVQTNPAETSDGIYEGQDLAFAPWENLGAPDPATEEEVKRLILELAANPRHLLNAPPSDATFNFEEWLPVALTAIRKDTALRDCRFSLVPKEIDEERFWSNYFFRVNTIKKAYSLSDLPQMKEGVTSPPPNILRSSLNSSTSSAGKKEADAFESNLACIPPPAPGEPNLVGLLVVDDAESDSQDDSDDSPSTSFDYLRSLETPLSASPTPFGDLSEVGPWASSID